ncbi:hypothetical protein EDB89DRAFT_774110 [Lactarius sanguifluus]|nr:hypothetical protein EDB89DRAFT_774110 [Lactarius sanguifluus]
MRKKTFTSHSEYESGSIGKYMAMGQTQRRPSSLGEFRHQPGPILWGCCINHQLLSTRSLPCDRLQQVCKKFRGAPQNGAYPAPLIWRRLRLRFSQRLTTNALLVAPIFPIAPVPLLDTGFNFLISDHQAWQGNQSSLNRGTAVRPGQRRRLLSAMEAQRAAAIYSM